MNALPVLVAVLAAVNSIAFALSVIWVFRSHDGARGKLNLLKLGAVTTAIFEVALILQAETDPIWLVLAAVMLLDALTLYAWCIATHQRRKLTLAFSNDEPQHIVTWGPYRYVRHPFYLSYLTTYAAGFVATWHPLMFVLTGVMAWIYFDAARTEERKFEGSSLAPEYETYRGRTGMLLPNPLKTLASGQLEADEAEV